jgi:putative AdoMet-dependent methyltransferase
MRSKHVDRFNHDQGASSYDEDVCDEENPIRAGYEILLAWAADHCTKDEGAEAEILELGSGTGNLTVRLRAYKRLVCVDTSERMLARAREKLKGRSGIEFVRDDLLGFFETNTAEFDFIVSTYAVHHLEQDEKEVLLKEVAQALGPGGVAVFGDLMFADDPGKKELLTRYRAEGKTGLVEEIEDEFFWSVARSIETAEGLGFTAETVRFSDLSWGLLFSR